MANDFRTFRLVCSEEEAPIVERLLKAQGLLLNQSLFIRWPAG